MILQSDAAHLPLANNSIDCLVTDPPYGTGTVFGGHSDRREDYLAWLWDIWVECGRVVKDGGFLVYTNRIAHLKYVFDPPPPWRFFHVGVWHKPLSLAGTWYGIAPHWEPIIMWLKGDKPWRDFRNEKVQSDVFSHNVVSGPKRNGLTSHPTVKPVVLMEEIIDLVCPLGGIVMDCFLGSGSTLLASRNCSREAIGLDIHLPYCLLAQARLNGHTDSRIIAGQGRLL